MAYPFSGNWIPLMIFVVVVVVHMPLLVLFSRNILGSFIFPFILKELKKRRSIPWHLDRPHLCPSGIWTQRILFSPQYFWLMPIYLIN